VALWMGAGRSAGWFKEGAGISACALEKETGGVLGRGSRLAVARPGEVGKTGLARRARVVSGRAHRARALRLTCGVCGSGRRCWVSLREKAGARGELASWAAARAG
jgi:hypothetical protein